MNIKKIKHIYTLDNGNGNVMAYCLDPHAEKPTAQPITNEFGTQRERYCLESS